MSPTTTPDGGAKQTPSTQLRFSRSWKIILSLAFLCAFLAWFRMSVEPASNAEQKKAQGRERRVPVAAVPARKGDMPVYLNGLGSVIPYQTVLVRTRVDGQLMKVLFREGQIVRAGDVLAEIDPRPFQVQLVQAEGQLARDRAQLENAQVDLERFRLLFTQDSIAKQQLDTQDALVRQLEGVVRTDQGLIENAKLQLDYARITAPIGGRVGLRGIDPGNIVHATDTTGIVTIAQVQPISVTFPIPEDSIPTVIEPLRKGKHLLVEAYDRQMTRRLSAGRLLTIDNQIDPATGTVRCKAEFPNRSNELFPNQFVNARLVLEVRRGLTIVPASAIQRGPSGAYVYVVKSDQTASVRQVTIGVSHEDNVSVTRGVAPGELVVVSGAERLRDNSPVEVRSAGTQTRDTGKDGVQRQTP